MAGPVTDNEVLELLRQGNEARAAATAALQQEYDGAEAEVAKCWAAHMMSDIPEEKLEWNMESFRAAEAAATDPRASTLLPTVLGNVGFSKLLMARPAEARSWYAQAMKALDSANIEDARRSQYRAGISHMLSVIDAAGADADASTSTT